MKDTEIISRLTARFPNVMRNTVKAVDQYSTFDFSNDIYLIEVKSRKKKYDPWLIEKHKVDANIEASSSTGHQVLYVTEYQKFAYIWNITRLLAEGYDFGWCNKNMPMTTEFSRRQWVSKEVGYVYEKDCKTVKLY